MLAALLATAALNASPSDPVLDMFRDLMRQDDPFAAAPRLIESKLSARPKLDGMWRRYDTVESFVELGPYDGRAPRKITIVAYIPAREAAVELFRQIFLALPISPRPPPPYEAAGACSYRGTFVIGKRVTGLEVDLAEAQHHWRVAVTLIAGGPRVVVPASALPAHADPQAWVMRGHQKAAWLEEIAIDSFPGACIVDLTLRLSGYAWINSKVSSAPSKVRVVLGAQPRRPPAGLIGYH